MFSSMRQMILSYMRRGQHQQLLRILFTLLLLTGRPPCIGPDLLSVSSQVGRKRKSIRRRSYLANNFNRIELGEIVQVALLCTQYVPAHRPEMSEVGQMLQWFRCCSAQLQISVIMSPFLSMKGIYISTYLGPLL